MKVNVERSYKILIAAVSTWMAALTLILFPTVGLTTKFYPNRPSFEFELLLLVATAFVAAAYSAYLGIKHIYPEGGKTRKKTDVMDS